jgi:hypothetical protein
MASKRTLKRRRQRKAPRRPRRPDDAITVILKAIYAPVLIDLVNGPSKVCVIHNLK